MKTEKKNKHTVVELQTSNGCSSVEPRNADMSHTWRHWSELIFNKKKSTQREKSYHSYGISNKPPLLATSEPFLHSGVHEKA